MNALPSYEEAATTVAQHAAALRVAVRETELVSLDASLGRVLAEPIYAFRDHPPFARATRDGFAVRAAEAHLPLSIVGQLRAGDEPRDTDVPAQSAIEIMTGAAVPAWADAVVMVEFTHVEKDRVTIDPAKLPKSGDNIVPQGAEGRKGGLQLDAGTRLRTPQLALAASEGATHLRVFTKPRVAIIPTGDELVPQGATPQSGQIFDSNGPMLAALVTEFGGIAERQQAAADTLAALDTALDAAQNADLLLLTGGVSMGRFDFVEQALAARHAEFFFTGARIQPGKPIVFGRLPRVGREPLYFFGLPGNPISSSVTFQLFAAPILAALSGSTHTHPYTLATLAAPVCTKPGLTRFLPAQLVETRVTLTPWHGSGDLPSLSRSNCLMVIPDGAEDLPVGATIRVLPLG